MEKDRKPNAADLASVESPELTDEQLAAMRPAAEVLPGLVARARKRGERGPQKKPTKKVVTMRLDPVIIRHFKKGGPGWQTRMNEALKKLVARDAQSGRFIRKAKLSAVAGASKKAARRA